MTDINKTIPVITIKAGTAVRIELDDTDGAFEIHYDTSEHRGQLVVKEADGLPDSYDRVGILYCEEFGTAVSKGETSKLECSPMDEDDDDDWGEYTFAIYWYGAKAWFNKEEVAWTNERVSGCEYIDPSLAHAQAYKLLQRHGLSEQIQVIRSDVQP